MDDLIARLERASVAAKNGARTSLGEWPRFYRTMEQVLNETTTALRASAEREKRMAQAIVWALGYTDFRGREEGEGAYWWRKELSTRAGLSDADCRALLQNHKENT